MLLLPATFQQVLVAAEFGDFLQGYLNCRELSRRANAVFDEGSCCEIHFNIVSHRQRIVGATCGPSLSRGFVRVAVERFEGLRGDFVEQRRRRWKKNAAAARRDLSSTAIPIAATPGVLSTLLGQPPSMGDTVLTSPRQCCGMV